jgi:hypothetical protein
VEIFQTVFRILSVSEMCSKSASSLSESMEFSLFILDLEAELLLSKNMLIGEVPETLCGYRAKNLRSLWADCKPSTESKTIRNYCPYGCCTLCTVGTDK